MKNLWTTITVMDMDRAVKFYNEDLGLVLNKRYKPAEHMEIAFLGSGETQFELIHNATLERIEYSGWVSTGFQVDSVATERERLSALGYKVTDIVNPAPFIKFFYVFDPDGYKIQLAEIIE